MSPPVVQIDVFELPLAADAESVDALETLLAEQERARARRFIPREARRRFVVTRAVLRTMLADRLGCEPAEVEFEYGKEGKPRVPGADAPRFNVSHSRERALLAFAEGMELGVDVEAVAPHRVREGLMRHALAPRERERALSLDLDERAALFFDAWAAKEALSKVSGAGIGIAFTRFETPPARPPGEPSPMEGSEDPRLAGLAVARIPVADGYAAAVAAEGEGWRAHVAPAGTGAALAAAGAIPR